MNIYFWDNVLIDYTSGIMVAVANSVEDARASILEECSYVVAEDLAKEPQVFDTSKAKGFVCWGGG